VVVSETVQRLGRFNIQVDYVTYLDIHDFGQDPIPKDEFFHDPAVPCHAVAKWCGPLLLGYFWPCHRGAVIKASCVPH
jgi:hypothetical protein